MIEVIKFEKRGKEWIKKVDHRFNSKCDMKNWKAAVQAQTKSCKMYLTYQEV